MGDDSGTADFQYEVASIDDFSENDAIVVEVGGEEIAVFCTGDAYYALKNVCPHQGGPLGKGKIEDGCVYCPWHGWQFNLEDGSHVHGEQKAEKYDVTVEDGTVYVLK